MRRCTSLAFRFHGARAREGRPAQTPRTRFELAQRRRKVSAPGFISLGYSHQTLFQDYPGFAAHASPHLRSEPPVGREEDQRAAPGQCQPERHGRKESRSRAARVRAHRSIALSAKTVAFRGSALNIER